MVLLLHLRSGRCAPRFKHVVEELPVAEEGEKALVVAFLEVFQHASSSIHAVTSSGLCHCGPNDAAVRSHHRHPRAMHACTYDAHTWFVLLPSCCCSSKVPPLNPAPTPPPRP